LEPIDRKDPSEWTDSSKQRGVFSGHVATSAVLLSSAVGLDRKLSGTWRRLLRSWAGRPAQLIVAVGEPPATSYDHNSEATDTVHPETSVGRRRVAVCKAGRADPTLERLLVMPPGDDQPLVAPVGGSEQLESLEPLLVVNCAGAGGKALAPARLGHRPAR